MRWAFKRYPGAGDGNRRRPEVGAQMKGGPPNSALIGAGEFKKTLNSPVNCELRLGRDRINFQIPQKAFPIRSFRWVDELHPGSSTIRAASKDTGGPFFVM